MDTEEKIAEQLEAVSFLDDIKKLASGDESVLGRKVTTEDLKTVASYMMFLENRAELDLKKYRFQAPADQDIQIIFKDPGQNNMLTEAKIMTLNGRVKIQGGVKGYVQSLLEEAPEDMLFTLIEETQRKIVGPTSVKIVDGKAILSFEDGTTRRVPLDEEGEVAYAFEEDPTEDEDDTWD